jgi:hypothetical protein
MSPAVIAVLAASAIIVLLAVLGLRFEQLQRGYYFGVHLWSRWLPVAAIGVFIAVVFVNLVGAAARGPLAIGSFLAVPELALLALAGPLMLTRYGNVMAMGLVAYLLVRVLGAANDSVPTPAIHFFLGPLTVVAVLGDKMPWRLADGPNALAQKIREILLVLSTVGAIAIVGLCIFKVVGFARWTNGRFGLPITPPATLFLLFALFTGWVTVALDLTRNFTIPLLGLPTLFVFAFVTGWPSPFLIVPFAVCMSLSLSTAERRVVPRSPRMTGYG